MLRCQMLQGIRTVVWPAWIDMEVVSASAMANKSNAFLAKPYTSVELLARVKQLMAQPITRVSTHI